MRFLVELIPIVALIIAAALAKRPSPVANYLTTFAVAYVCLFIFSKLRKISLNE